MTEATNAALTADTGPDRFATVIDALAYSPVRQQVVPLGIPAEPGDALLAAIKKLASRVPQIAALFGVEASPARPPRSKGRGTGSGPRSRPVPAPPPHPSPATPPPGGASAPLAVEATAPAPETAAAPETVAAPEAAPAAVVEPIDDAASSDNPDVIEQDQPVQDDSAVAPAVPTASASVDDAASPDNPDVIEQAQSVDEGELVDRPEGY